MGTLDRTSCTSVAALLMGMYASRMIIFDAIADLEASLSKEKRILVENIHPVNILSHGLVIRNKVEVTRLSLVLFAPHVIGRAIQKAP
mmetsp:Transcript_25823/g.85083  ORF Transcript_25823/g.85083 Transcript_25823/m.85083 type:complete len:88 (-) Transcript_25823:116-379(-)